MKTETNCGACGQFFGKDEADEIGYHLAKFCDASEEEVFCDVCRTNEDLLNERDKRELTIDWAGVNFYSELCRPCFLEIKEKN